MGEILVSVAPERTEEARTRLARIFGIAWFAPISIVSNDLERISSEALRLLQPVMRTGMSFAVSAQRSAKSVTFTSIDAARRIGDVIRQETGAHVNLTSPDVTIHIAIHRSHTSIFTEKVPGPGGLPIGTSGRVLSLVSGGFDSIASSYLMAKRGAQVDFVHFHVFPRLAGLLTSKMPALWLDLADYTQSSSAYAVEYIPFQLRILGQPKVYSKVELIIFRRLMVRVAERLARAQGYDALVLGDSLGQVASQTMDNIVAVDDAVSIPIFRPLIGLDKVDIIRLVRTAGLEAHAIAPYKDCCSIISKHPATSVKLSIIHQIEHTIGIDGIVDEMAAQVEAIVLKSIKPLDHMHSTPSLKTIRLHVQ